MKTTDVSRLRAGRKVGRTIYAQHGAAPSDGDQLVGMVDTPELAAEICSAVNAARAAGADLDQATHFLIGGFRVGYREISGVWQVWGDAAHGGYTVLPEPESYPDRDAALARARQLAKEAPDA